jgi:hypothetical protein
MIGTGFILLDVLKNSVAFRFDLNQRFVTFEMLKYGIPVLAVFTHGLYKLFIFYFAPDSTSLSFLDWLSVLAGNIECTLCLLFF